ncbi:hypothetical protein HY988_03510 [Candidatus Micrarchaeota archaeon]|nr:hypothetical protein [Candidatus Micrarchaeota archaeon]
MKKMQKKIAGKTAKTIKSVKTVVKKVSNKNLSKNQVKLKAKGSKVTTLNPPKKAMKTAKPLTSKVAAIVEIKNTELTKADLATIATILADSNIRQTLIELGGENALALIRNIRGSHSDDELAKKLKLKISDVRATLNKLHSEGIVNYLREKDNETGWYSYSWSLNVEKIGRWAGKQNNRSTLNSGSDHYACASCGAHSIVDFETAMTINFKCDRCEKLLEFVDEKMIGNLFENRK